jgi:SAM-dependent methyltransferase
MSPPEGASATNRPVVHPVAAAGFDREAEAYERGRPDYPGEAVAWLAERAGVGEGATVLDLGAGTGKLTRRLLATGARAIALEPVAGMRRVLRRALPGAWVVAGVAEAIPLRDSSVDAVTAGAAFHWFDGPATLEAVHRVLRPGGRLALIWSRRDQADPLQRAVSGLIDPYRGDAPRHGSKGWMAAFRGNGRFGPLRAASFPFVQEVDADGLVDRVRSISFVASAPGAERERVLRRVRALAPRSGEPVRLAYVVEAYVTERR